ncbi:hypothetical protein [Deefgea salmonis]|uniref:Uncharacterized protein n=1 Tax=Deefgea salmonis TaxID=2875502 RepID=A0ABS8BJH7_9NEIS|nr:hypothetical protein [Deefgea salmonis]MCB5195888.1 hypothetical protein [Deefgea salmonis]
MNQLYPCVCIALLSFPLYAATIQLEEPAGSVLTWSSDSAKVGKFTLYKPIKDSAKCTSDSSRKLQSVVGPIISFMSDFSSDCEGAAHGSAAARFEVFDARTGKELAITSWFSEATILVALKADPIVAKTIKGIQINSLSDLAKKAATECEFSYFDLEHSYAFHHIKGNQVAVRFGLSHGCEVMRGNFTQIGVYLPIPDSLRPWLEKANASGLLMNRMEIKNK